MMNEKEIDFKCRKKLFVRFLKENNVYSSYTNKINKMKKTNIDGIVKVAITNKSPSEIVNSFYWRYTNEGFDFWYNLSSKWTKLITYEYNKKKKNASQIFKRK